MGSVASMHIVRDGTFHRRNPYFQFSRFPTFSGTHSLKSQITYLSENFSSRDGHFSEFAIMEHTTRPCVYVTMVLRISSSSGSSEMVRSEARVAFHTAPPLQAAPSSARSVASLSQFPGRQLPRARAHMHTHMRVHTRTPCAGETTLKMPWAF